MINVSQERQKVKCMEKINVAVGALDLDMQYGSFDLDSL